MIAEAFLFDYDKYQNQLLPHFCELVFRGKIDNWIAQLELDCWNAYHKGKQFKFVSRLSSLEIDTETNKTYLDKNLALKLEFSTKIPDFENELIADLFHFAILRDCFGQGHFVGRMSFTWNFIDYCKKRGWLNNPQLSRMLLALRYRGCYLASSNYGDGIKGWLNPEETWEFAQSLHHLPLPEYEASLEAIGQFRKSSSNGKIEYSHPDFDIYSLLLSFVRTLSDMAEKEGKGLVWVHGSRSYLLD